VAEVVTHGTTGYICQRPEDLVGLSLRKPPAAVREKVTKMTDVLDLCSVNGRPWALPKQHQVLPVWGMVSRLTSPVLEAQDLGSRLPEIYHEVVTGP
jgi:hypothetical protein